MTEQPEPVDDSYPSSWKPQYIRERDAKLDPTEMELAIGAMTPAELQLLLQRARGSAN
jgi:hypothetical protein